MLSTPQVERYSRHLLLDEVGSVGQQKLLDARVLIVGLGGLGSPAALYLAAAGVGHLGLVDHDEVDLTNLQRQVIHHTPDVGTPKVDSAAAKLRALNPDVTVTPYRQLATVANAVDLIGEYDFVIDGTDNFSSKFLLNDAAYFARTPFCHAGVLRFIGQLMTVVPGATACYRCLFESPPPQGSIPRCSQAGVLGVVPGVLGTLQATEAIKHILGLGELLTDALLTYDATTMEFRKVEFARNPRCPLCGEVPRITLPGSDASHCPHARKDRT